MNGHLTLGAALPRQGRIRLAAFVVLAFADACDGSVSPTSRDIAFVSPVVSIGAVDGAEEYLFTRIHSVALAPDGDIVVADQAPRVAVFSDSGVWRGDLGRRGRGPGELQLPSGMWFPSLDTVAVWDALQRKIVMYPLTQGRPREVRIPWGPSARPVDGARGIAVLEVETGQLMDTARAVSRLIALADDDSTTILGPYGVPEIGWEVEEGGRGHMVSPPVFESYPAWEVTTSGVWWADPLSPHVMKVDWSGAQIAALDVPFRVESVSDADKDAFYAGLAARYGVDRPASGDDPFSNVAPIVTRIVADDRGWLWLAGFDAASDPLRGWVASEYIVTAVAGAGEHRRVTFPDGFMLTDVRGGLAAGIYENQDGIHFAHIYDVRTVYGDGADDTVEHELTRS